MKQLMISALLVVATTPTPGAEPLADSIGRAFDMPRMSADAADPGREVEAVEAVGSHPERSAGAAGENWSFLITPDAWLNGVTGDQRIGGTTSDLDIKLSDVGTVLTEYLDMTFALYAEGRKGRWIGFFDMLYLELSGDFAEDVRLSPKISGRFDQLSIQGSGIKFDIDAHLETVTSYYELGGGYRFFDGPSSGRTDWLSRVTADIIGGLRMYYMSTELDLDVKAKSTVTVSDGSTSASRTFRAKRRLRVDESEFWVDPFIGVKAQADFSDKAYMWLRGDVGGFGVGSDFAWKAGVGLAWRFTPGTHGYLGVRALGIDYDDDDYALDAVYYGPILGFATVFGGPGDQSGGG